jgi:predicted Zn-dependent peptidase
MSKTSNHYNAFLGETVHVQTLDSGLRVYIIPKRGFTKKYAFFATRYGGISNHFKLSNGEEVNMPMGIAHFLEHQIFEDQEESTFVKFEKIGANVNAYTSNTSTVYYFDTVHDFDKGLGYLMELVQNTSITAETVEKEKGIIIQEINMYKDELDWSLTMNLYRAMYHNHPIIHDIAGTVESVSGTSAEEILACYHHFYTPNNMSVFIYGDVNPEETFKLVDSLQTPKFRAKSEVPLVLIPDEPHEIKEKRIEIKGDIPKDRFYIGFKADPLLFGDESNKYAAAIRVANDIIFGRSSKLYEKAMQQGLITDGFDVDSQFGKGYAFAVVGGESKNIDALYELIIEALKEALEKGLDEDDFKRMKRKLVGRLLISFNALQSLASNYTYHIMKGTDLFDYVNWLQELDYDDVMAALKVFYDVDNHAISVIRKEEPSKEEI